MEPRHTRDGAHYRAAAAHWLLAFAALAMTTQSAYAYRVAMYWQGPKAGTMELLQNGVATGFLEIPQNACGFRLIKPGAYADGPPELLWDEGWHFAAGATVAPPMPIYNSQDFNVKPAFIQATGPLAGNCEDAAYQFITPATASIGYAAPPGSGAFIADFVSDDYIEWLDYAGEAIDASEPSFPEDPERPDRCGVPEFCELPTDLTNCIIATGSVAWCDIDGSLEATIDASQVAALVSGYGSAAEWAVGQLRNPLERDKRELEYERAQAAIENIEKLIPTLEHVMIRLERELGARNPQPEARALVRRAATSIAMASLSVAGCRAEVEASHGAQRRAGHGPETPESKNPDALSGYCRRISSNALDAAQAALYLDVWSRPARSRRR